VLERIITNWRPRSLFIHLMASPWHWYYLRDECFGGFLCVRSERVAVRGIVGIGLMVNDNHFDAQEFQRHRGDLAGIFIVEVAHVAYTQQTSAGSARVIPSLLPSTMTNWLPLFRWRSRASCPQPSPGTISHAAW